MNKKNKIFILFFILIFILLGLFVFLNIPKGLPSNTFVLGKDMKEMTPKEALSYLKKEKEIKDLVIYSPKKTLKAKIQRKIKEKPLLKKLQTIEQSVGFFDRVFQKNKEVNIQITYSYSKKEVQKAARKIKEINYLPAKQAQVIFVNHLQVKKGKRGSRLKGDVFKKINKAAKSGKKSIVLKKENLRPRILNKKDVFDDSPVILVVNKTSFELLLYNKKGLQDKFKVAIGQPGFETPSGSFRIQNKAVEPAWHVPEWGGSLAGQVIPGGSSENPLIARWLGVYDGVGIHGTREIYSLGSAASHGCIRMDPEEVVKLYEVVPVNSRIIIV